MTYLLKYTTNFEASIVTQSDKAGGFWIGIIDPRHKAGGFRSMMLASWFLVMAVNVLDYIV